MPSLGFRTRVWTGFKPTPAQRLERWIQKRALPPAHMVKRPLLYRLPDKLCKANNFETHDVWLVENGELHLGNPKGRVIGELLA